MLASLSRLLSEDGRLSQPSAHLLVVITSPPVDEHLLVQQLVDERKGKCNSVILSAGHATTHYTIVAAQLGLMGNKFVSSEGSGDGCRVVEGVPPASAAQLIDKVEQTIARFADCSRPLCIVVEDISSLLDVGMPLRDVCRVINKLHKLVAATSGGLLVTTILQHLPAVEGEEEADGDYARLFDYVAASSDSQVTIEPVGSSYAKDVTGKITVSRSMPGATEERNTSLLYLLTERSIKFMQHGQLQFAL